MGDALNLDVIIDVDSSDRRRAFKRYKAEYNSNAVIRHTRQRRSTIHCQCGLDLPQTQHHQKRQHELPKKELKPQKTSAQGLHVYSLVDDSSLVMCVFLVFDVNVW